MVSTPTVRTNSPANSGCQYLPIASHDSADRSPNQSLLPLTAQVNSQDHLEIGGCDVTELVQQFGTPLYILDETTLRTACRQYRQAFATYYPGESLVIYASKAWNCLAVCAIVASEGLGIDVVSGGELYTAQQAGVSPAVTYFHGNNKSIAELQMGIEAGCTIVVDNWHELETLAQLASQLTGTSKSTGTSKPTGTSKSTGTSKPTANPVRIMLRLTPGIECHTHEYIRTGHLDSKFGFDPDQLDRVFAFVSQQQTLDCVGLHAHIGSQIFELQPHQDLGAVMVQWLSKAAQHGLSMRELDIGGGLGIRYTEADDPPSIDQWVQMVCQGVVQACEAQGIPLPKLIAEPGRSLIGSACVTAYTVGGQKTIPGIRTYVSVDGGMSDNPRPITYQSVYRSLVADRMAAPATETVTIAGKHCESGDIVIKQAQLPATEPGDTIVIMATGAYNYSMASNYNRLTRPAAIVVQSGQAEVILKRETIEDLVRHDRLPQRLIGE